MFPFQALEAPAARAFERAMNDGAVASSVEQTLLVRRDQLRTLLHNTAVRALTDESARGGALILRGQLYEVESLLDIVGRFIETGSTKVPTTTPKPLRA